MAAAVGAHPGLDYLGLLKGEIVDHVRRAAAAIDPTRHRGGDAGAAVCVDAMQQVEGVLHTLGLERLTLLAQEILRVARGLGGLPRERQEEVVGILRNALDQLRDAVERRAAGRSEALWGLMAVLGELRACTSLPLLSEACLFAPDLDEVLAREAVAPATATSALAEVARHERVVLHRGLFLWYSGREPERGLRKLRRVARHLREAASTESLRRLFLALEGFVAGCAEQTVTAGGTIRRVLAGVDQLIKQVGEQGEEAVAAAVPVELLRNLLFCVATSGSVDPVARAVRDGTDLRLVVASGFDGIEQVAPLLLAEVERVRASVARAERDRATFPALAGLAAAVQRLSDGLALADLGDQRAPLGGPLEVLHRIAGGATAVSDPLPDLAEVLGAIDATLRARGPGGAPADEKAEPAPASEADRAVADMALVEQEVAAVDQQLERLSAAQPGAAPTHGLAPLDAEIREVFLDEAVEKVGTLLQQYVAWSAERDDHAALDAVLAALDSLKSTGRLVGADTLSEICWVLEAALRGCREGAFAASDEALGVLDGGIEMVESLVNAYVRGGVVEGDPRVVEQRLYTLLTPVKAGAAGRLPAVAGQPPPGSTAGPGPSDLDLDLDLKGVAPEGEAIEGDFDLVELFAEEAGDLADALEEGLRGLEQDPARSAWLMEMRRALRALAVAARHAELHPLQSLCEAFDTFLGRTAEAGAGIGPDALALTREATGTVAGVVGALRSRRLPHLPAGLVDRLRQSGAGVAPAGTAGAQAAGAPRMPGGGEGAGEMAPPAGATALDPALAGRLAGRAAGAGVCHLQLEEQMAALRAQVGRLEGTLVLLRRQPTAESGAALPSRVTAALTDLGGCADRLHETTLAISALLRAQGHQLTGLQQGLAAALAGQSGPSFTDLLLVGVGDAVYGFPAAAIDSVRRIAADILPADGGVLDLRGRSFAYRDLAGLLAVRRDEPTAAAGARSVVLAQVGDRACALAVDRVLGHRTLLVTAADGRAADPPWLAGRASLGADREALVVDLGLLLTGS